MENPLFDVLGDRRAPPGSEAWAKAWRADLASCLKDSTIDVGTVEVTYSIGEKYEAWKLLRSANGKPFSSFDEFCEAPEPYGCGTPSKTVRVFVDAVRGKVAGTALTARSVIEHGGVREGSGRPLDNRDGAHYVDNNQVDVRQLEKIPKKSKRTVRKSGGSRVDYWAGRIERDAPEIHTRMLRGEFQTVADARRAAGGKIAPKPPDPVTVAKCALRKVPPERLAEVQSVDLKSAKAFIRRLSADEQGELYAWLKKELGL